MSEDLSPADYANSIRESRQRFSRFVQRCTDGEWRSAPVEGDPRTVGVIADHVADAYEYLGDWISDLVAGRPVHVDSGKVDELNAAHAGEASAVTPAHVSGHLRSSGDALTGLVARLKPGQLDLDNGRVRRLAAIAAHHADEHRTQLETALAAAG